MNATRKPTPTSFLAMYAPKYTRPAAGYGHAHVSAERQEGTSTQEEEQRSTTPGPRCQHHA